MIVANGRSRCECVHACVHACGAQLLAPEAALFSEHLFVRDVFKPESEKVLRGLGRAPRAARVSHIHSSQCSRACL